MQAWYLTNFEGDLITLCWNKGPLRYSMARMSPLQTFECIGVTEKFSWRVLSYMCAHNHLPFLKHRIKRWLYQLDGCLSLKSSEVPWWQAYWSSVKFHSLYGQMFISWLKFTRKWLIESTTNTKWFSFASSAPILFKTHLPFGIQLQGMRSGVTAKFNGILRSSVHNHSCISALFCSDREPVPGDSDTLQLP